LQNLLIAAALIGVLAACGQTEQDPASDTREFIDPADETTLHMVAGEDYTLSLTSNPTTGYFWACEIGNDKIAVLTRDDYIADPAPEGLVGSGGRQVFTIYANQDGQSQLACSYERSPEDVAERRDFKLFVKAE